jgi:hypothetical protein
LKSRERWPISRIPAGRRMLDGDLDMRLLDPITGYRCARGHGSSRSRRCRHWPAFQIDGGVHIDNGSYLGAGVTATGITSTRASTPIAASSCSSRRSSPACARAARSKAPSALAPWLPGARFPPRRLRAHSPQLKESRRASQRSRPPRTGSSPSTAKSPPISKDVALDTVLDMVCPPQYRRLGLDARVNGPAIAVWSHGDGARSSRQCAVWPEPLQQTPAGEAPTTGAIDATYTQRNGSVDLRKLELHLPASDLEAHGVAGRLSPHEPFGAHRRFPLAQPG